MFNDRDYTQSKNNTKITIRWVKTIQIKYENYPKNICPNIYIYLYVMKSSFAKQKLSQKKV